MLPTAGLLAEHRSYKVVIRSLSFRKLRSAFRRLPAPPWDREVHAATSTPTVTTTIIRTLLITSRIHPGRHGSTARYLRLDSLLSRRLERKVMNCGASFVGRALRKRMPLF